ncbi:hypothetical protein BC830DRAFT_1220374 [Chytriomyces sp. MP71]|nr:hypothetical protein BC830DRAFT_1220374 [Chytriomyces sp. MP71]
MSKRFMPFAGGVLVTATAYSIFKSQIEHDRNMTRRQLHAMSAELLKAADEHVPVEKIEVKEPSLISKVFGLGSTSTSVFGTNSYRGTYNQGVEHWNNGVKKLASFLTGEHL